MLRVFYAYTEGYKHDDCFLKTNKPLQYEQNNTSQNFKMSVTRRYRSVCCEMNVFFRRFHRSLSENP